MNIIILVAIYIVELLKYWFFIGGFLNVKLKNKWLGMVGLGGYVILNILLKTDINEILLIMYLIVYGVVLSTMNAKMLYRITNFLIAVLIISCTDTMFGIFMGGIHYQRINTISQESISLLLSSCVSFAIITILGMLKIKMHLFNKESNKKVVKRSIPILMFMITFFLLLTISGVNYAKAYVHKDSFTLMANILIVVSSISIVFLIWCIVYINNTNKKMEEMIETERSLKEMQLNYYKEMLAREESTRKYRHDMKNHLICLNQLAKVGTSNSVQEYLSNMQNQVLDIESKVLKVGNEILDAILNYHLSMLDKDVKVEITSFCSEIARISNIDLCTIFANLIQNAVEELKKESSGEKYFKVVIQRGKEFIKIEIINSISDKSHQKSDLLRSKKRDKQNHGIGLGNVRQTVEKNGGSFETTTSNHIFVARVILNRM